MFALPMAEKLTGKLVIKDYEPEIVEEFLRFLYTGAVADLAKNPTELFRIADKYDVQDLKILVEQSILEIITHENVLVVELYEVGKQWNSTAIVRQTVEKIKT
jgi:BTB/POZ domain